MKWERLLPAITVAVLFGCSSGDSSPSAPDDGGTGLTVEVRNNLFDPTPIQVPVNGTVIWMWNSGGVEHNVTFQAGSSSGNRTSGSFPRTFPSAGSFTYVCTIHALEGMSGVVNVTASSGGSGGGGAGGGGGGGYP